MKNNSPHTKTKWFTSLKNFLYTYSEVVKLAWSVRKDLFLISTIVNLLSGILIYPQLWITKQLVDAVIDALSSKNAEDSIRKIVFFIAIEFFIQIIKRLINRFDWVFSQTLARYLQVEIEVRTAKKINSIPVYLSENPANRDLYRKITENVGRSAWTLVMPISALPYSLSSIISVSFTLFQNNPLLIPISLMVSIPEILIGTKNNKEAYNFDTKVAKLHRIAGSYLHFVDKGRYIYENKILGQTQMMSSKFMDIISNQIFNPRYSMWIRFAKRRFLSSIPLGVVNSIIRGYFYIQAILGKITLGSAQMQIGAAGTLVENFSGLGKQINEVYENYLYVKDYEKFMGLEDEQNRDGKTIVSPLTTGIEFKDVWFKYPQNKRWTLKGVNFKVNITDNIAIVGKNGAGKTTIIKLLCRFYSPQKGEILVNGININEYSIQEYRNKLSALFQEFAEYPFSAKENIGFGDLYRLDNIEEIKTAAKLTGIHDFIEGLPKGYDNPLDNEFEGGIEPSKGQWQRLALARALFRKAEVFILDEPTSNVDPEAEEEIFEKIITLAKEKIVFLISHRFSTVKKADKILLLDKGVVAEYGSHEELMKADKEYAKLFRLQAESYKN